MRRSMVGVVACAVVLGAGAAGAALDFKGDPAHEAAKRELYERVLAPAEGLETLNRVRNVLESFRNLTQQELRRRFGSEWEAVYAKGGIEGVSFTAADMQTVGFDSMPEAIRGVILKAEYERAAAQYQLAECQRGRGKSSKAVLAAKAKELKDAEEALQKFLDSYHYEE